MYLTRPVLGATIAIMTVCLVLWAGAFAAPQDATVELKYRLKFSLTTGDANLPPRITRVVEGVERPETTITLFPGDDVTVKLANPETEWEMSTWSSSFLWNEEVGRGDTQPHRAPCPYTFKGAVGMTGPQIVATRLRPDGTEIGSAKRPTSTESSVRFDPTTDGGTLDVVMFVPGLRNQRPPTESELRRDCRSSDGRKLESKYHLESGPTFMRMANWTSELIVEVTITRTRGS
jgi:hypothetical protein